ncbi:hypothetical protein ACFWHR_03860 [Leucobacter sp. NPDC058333]|uniref:hypothetical protein n=1 Tax=Leucobacter sp. NPDC058333 TaxID=3346450 RepID=UPI00364875C5
MAEQIAWIELCGLTFGGADEADSGLVWENLEGWDGLTDARGGGDPIPGAHGRFARRNFIPRSERPITLSGFVLGEDYADMVATRDRLTAALAAGVGTMRVATSAGIWERDVEIDSMTPLPDHGDRVVDFTIDMVAPDPRRYGPWLTVGPASLPQVSGGVRLPQRFPWNFGTVAAGGRLIVANPLEHIPMHPIIRVSGGFEAVSVRDITAGRRLSLDWQVAETDSVTLDSRVRRAEMSGSEVTRWMTSRQWFEIPPGETHEFRFDVEGRVGDPQMWADYRIGAM